MGKLRRKVCIEISTSPMMILWMIFGESQVKRIAFATTPESMPMAFASSLMLEYAPSSINSCQWNPLARFKIKGDSHPVNRATSLATIRLRPPCVLIVTGIEIRIFPLVEVIDNS